MSHQPSKSNEEKIRHFKGMKSKFLETDNWIEYIINSTAREVEQAKDAETKKAVEEERTKMKEWAEISYKRGYYDCKNEIC